MADVSEFEDAKCLEVTPAKLQPLIQPQQEDSSIPIPYSIFTKAQKRLIVSLVAFSAMFSTLSSFIYYPAINSLSRDLNVSIEKINLTITSYMLVSGLAPAILGDLTDMTGRRWVYLLTLCIYCCANVGLALQRSWAALLVLRMAQSFGISATISMAYGVVADISTPAERGAFVGAVLCGPNVAPSLGPAIGGALSQHAGWWWIFWFLALLSGFCLVLVALFLPETSRLIVGNGSILPEWHHRTLIQVLISKSPIKDQSKESERLPNRHFHIPNPVTCLRLLFHRGVALIVLVNGIFYTISACVQASMSSLFIQLYGFSELNAGLIYLPFGAGSAMGSLLSGRLMNRDYRLTAKDNGFTIDKVSGDDMQHFPIEKARFRSILYPAVISSVCIAGYGWSLHAHISVAAPLVLQFFIGAMISMILSMCGTLVVDLHPKSPASAQAAVNIVRCSLSAGGLAVQWVIIDSVGVGWCFTIFAGLCFSMLLPIWIVHRYGMIWRNKRVAARQISEEDNDLSSRKPR